MVCACYCITTAWTDLLQVWWPVESPPDPSLHYQLKNRKVIQIDEPTCISGYVSWYTYLPSLESYGTVGNQKLIKKIIPAILMSVASASSSPPPKAPPSSAVITGIGSVDTLLNILLPRVTSGPTSSSFIFALSFRSAPAQNIPGTSLLRMTTLTSRSIFTRSIASSSCKQMHKYLDCQVDPNARGTSLMYRLVPNLQASICYKQHVKQAPLYNPLTHPPKLLYNRELGTDYRVYSNYVLQW